MIERGYRDTRPFGLRRVEDRPDPRAAETRPGIGDWPEGGDWIVPARPAGPLAWALRTAALAGLVALFATQYLVRVSGPGEVLATRIAQGGRTAAADPETTGSIGRGTATTTARTTTARAAAATPIGAAQATRLDPCAIPR